jgi:hypothetical protein
LVTNYRELQLIKEKSTSVQALLDEGLPMLSDLLQNSKRKLLLSYLNHAIQQVSSNNEFSFFDKVVEFALKNSSSQQNTEFLTIIRKVIQSQKTGPDLNPRTRYSLLERLDALIEKEQINIKLSCKNVNLYKDKIPSFRGREETIEQRDARIQAVFAYTSSFQYNLLARHTIAMLKTYPTYEESSQTDVFLTRAVEYERARIGRYSEHPEIDMEMRLVLDKENSKPIGQWIKAGHLEKIDHFIDHVIKAGNEATDDAIRIAANEFNYSRMQSMIEGGVMRALRGWKGKVHRNSRIKTIKEMCHRLKELIKINGYIDDISYEQLYARIEHAVRAGVAKALPNKMEADRVWACIVESE